MKKILITEFVNHYNTLQNDTLKQKYVASVVKRKYVPILEKKALLQFMCKKSVVDKPFKPIDLVVNKVKKTDKCYYSNENPYYAEGRGMPNCVAYAWSRFYEVIGKISNFVGQVVISMSVDLIS